MLTRQAERVGLGDFWYIRDVWIDETQMELYRMGDVGPEVSMLCRTIFMNRFLR